ncbi:hypothetical protein U1Q18_024874 [Sarracenia purpurea var. burkii]
MTRASILEFESDLSAIGPSSVSGDELANGGLGGLLVDVNISGAFSGVAEVVGVAAFAGTSGTKGDLAGGDDAGVLVGGSYDFKK